MRCAASKMCIVVDAGADLNAGGNASGSDELRAYRHGAMLELPWFYLSKM